MGLEFLTDPRSGMQRCARCGKAYVSIHACEALNGTNFEWEEKPVDASIATSLRGILAELCQIRQMLERQR